MYKLVILVREDLNMSRGKLAAQVAHASVECVLKTLKKDPEKVEKWRKEGAKKVVLGVNNLEELLKYKELAEKEGLVTVLIEDAGRTELEPGTITCLGIGPDLEEKIDKITGHLKLLK